MYSSDKLLKEKGSTLGTETKAFYRMVSKGKISGFFFCFFTLSQRKIKSANLTFGNKIAASVKLQL